MSGYYSLPGINEPVFVILSDWIGYFKDDGTIGYIMQNGVSTLGGADWATLTGKPSTFPPTIGTTATTAKAGNYSPTWVEINSVIPEEATFPAILGTSSTTAKPGNWYPDWTEIQNKPTFPDTSWVISYVSAQVDPLVTGLGNTYTRTEMNAVLNNKADVNYMIGLVDGKVDNYKYNSEVPLKANTADVNAALLLKASNSDLTSALALKANVTDLTGKLSTPTVSYTARALNTIYQVSATRPASVSYSVQLTVTASISGGQNGDVILEVSPSATFASGVQTVAIAGLGQTYTLAVAIQGVQPQTSCVAGIVPAGWYARLRTVNVTGTPTFTVRATQEATL